MKTLIAASIFTLMSGVASAQAFDFEQRLGSPDLHPTIGAPEIATRTSDRPVRISLEDFYRGNPDVDTNLRFRYVGDPAPSTGDVEISYERFIKGSDADPRA